MKELLFFVLPVVFCVGSLWWAYRQFDKGYRLALTHVKEEVKRKKPSNREQALEIVERLDDETKK
jgi:hypothetical protein